MKFSDLLVALHTGFADPKPFCHVVIFLNPEDATKLRQDDDWQPIEDRVGMYATNAGYSSSVMQVRIFKAVGNLNFLSMPLHSLATPVIASWVN